MKYSMILAALLATAASGSALAADPAAADKLAGEVDGLLMDMERKPLTEYQLAQYFDELRAYDNQ